jgi:poly(hydroxyalkanoate) granule-associated protein
MTKKHEEDAFERLSASARRIWLAGLGAIAEAEKRGDEIFESLVKSGEGYEETLKKPLGKTGESLRESVETARSRASSALDDLERTVERQVAAAMKTMGIASKAEVDSLRREVAHLKKGPAKAKATRKSRKKGR